MLSFSTKSRRVALLFCALLWVVLVAVGCRSQTAPERVYERFIAALDAQDKAQAWGLLSKASQARWQAVAVRRGLASGKALFAKGTMMANQHLRPDPKAPPVVRKGRARLTFFDELNQTVRVELRKEPKGWRVHLGGHFLHTMRAGHRQALPTLAPKRSAPRKPLPTTRPLVRRPTNVRPRAAKVPVAKVPVGRRTIPRRAPAQRPAPRR